MPRDQQEDIHMEGWWKWIFFITTLVNGYRFVHLTLGRYVPMTFVIFVGHSRLGNTLQKDTEQNGVIMIVSDCEPCVLFFLLYCSPHMLENINIYYLIFLSKLDPEFHWGKIYYKLIVGVILACIFYEYCESYNWLWVSLQKFPVMSVAQF